MVRLHLINGHENVTLTLEPTDTIELRLILKYLW